MDNDPIVISHARSLLAKSPAVIAVPGDMRDPARILADPGLTDLIDLADPVCVILSGVLHFAQAAAARDVAAAFARAVVPGSYLIISVGSGNPSEGANFTSEYTAARVYIHSLEEIQSFFEGLDLVPSRRRTGPPLDRRHSRPRPEGRHRHVPGRRRPQALTPHPWLLQPNGSIR